MNAGRLTRTLLRLGLGAGLVLWLGGCTGDDSSPGAAGGADRQASSLGAAAPMAAPPSSEKPALPTPQDRDRFRRALEHKLDVSQVIARQGAPGAGILHVPNGRVAHAVVAVKNADGTVSARCLSSPAEVEALMKQSGAGQ